MGPDRVYFQVMYHTLLTTATANTTTTPHLMTSFPGQPGETSTRKVKLVWIKNEARDDVFWDAVASA